MLWLTQMMGYNEYIPLLKRQMNDAEENWLDPTIFDVPDSTVIFGKIQHTWNVQAPGQAPLQSAECSKRKKYLKLLASGFQNITSLFVLTNFEVKYLSQHIGYQNKYGRLKYYFLIKISEIIPIVIEQVSLCFKMSWKACL